MRFIWIALLGLSMIFAAPVAAFAFSEANTARVVRILEDGFENCQGVGEIYRLDCYRQVYRSASNSLKGKPDYREAQNALKGVEQRLKRLQAVHEDKSAPVIRVKGRRLKAIRPDALKTVGAAARQAVAEAETILLRAKGKAALHYVRIAQVVGSNKVIFRS